MPIKDGVIKAPVSISDVRQILGDNSTDVGHLCTSSKINMWAKYKPVRLRGIGASVNSTTWYRADDQKCGIDFTNAGSSSYTSIKDKYTENGYNGWGYKRPDGTNFPYRLTDFNNYMHNATPDIESFHVPEQVKENGTLVCYFQQSLLTVDGLELSFDDIQMVDMNNQPVDLGSCPVGIVVYDDATGKMVGRTGDGNTTQVSYNVRGLTLRKSYTVYPFFCLRGFTQEENDSLNYFYTIPIVKPGSFTIVTEQEAANLSIWVEAEYTYSGTTKTGVNWTIYIQNKGTNAFTFHKNYIQLRFFNSSNDSAMVIGESQQTIADFTVNGNATKDISGSFTNLTYGNKSYKLVIYLNSAQFVKEAQIEETLMPDQ